MTRPEHTNSLGRQSDALRVVEDALERPTVEREAFLQQATRGDAALGEAARELLRACELAERDGAFLSEVAMEFAEPIMREMERWDQESLEASLPQVMAALTGRYAFIRELGRGGSAVVHLARDLRHGRDVAIKVIRRGVVEDVQRSRFLHEISVVAQLRHPYIVPLLDSGEADGALFSVMPYVEGESLRQRLDREGALALDDALAITREVAEALDYAHARGIVHRDIKPQNILLGGGHALVADFGIALAIGTTVGDRLTEQGLAVGTPTYMSPEQATASARIDARSDVYSLGCVVYEMLAGEAPYTGVTPRAVIAKHMSAPVPDLAILRPGTTARLHRALEIALAKSPADRYASAGVFSAALTRAMDPLPGPRQRAPSPRWWIGVAGVVVAAVLGTVTVQRISARAAMLGSAVADTTRYAFFPIRRFDGDTAIPRDVSHVVIDALKSWSGLVLVDPSLVSGFSGLKRGVAWSVEEASVHARAAQAGRFVWGEASRSGDSLRVHLRLSDVSSRGLVLTDRVVHTTLGESARDTVIARAIDQLLVRPVRGLRGPVAIGTRSLPAQQAYVEAWRALLAWQLDSAERLLEAAIDSDPEFGRAHLWLALARAWSGAASARYSVPAEQASIRLESMTARERDLARAVLLESRGDLGQACPIWRRLALSDSSDFVGWLGAARCHQKDDVVQRDRRSPSGWSFRSSYHQAIREFETAFRLQPAILTSLQDRAFEPLQRLLYAGAYARDGRSNTRDSLRFVARMGWRGDSLAFVPWRDPATLSLPLRDDEVRAVGQQRAVMRDVATAWVASSPKSAGAHEALAMSMAMRGDIAARDTLAVALRLAAPGRERLRVTLAHLRMLLSFGVAGPDIESLRQARHLADSLLSGTTPEATSEPLHLASVAALVGRATLAARFATRGEVGRDMIMQPSLTGLAPALLTYSALGGPLDSIAWFASQLEKEIQRSLPPDERISARRRWLVRAATLCFPQCSVTAYASLRSDDYLLDAQLRLTGGDTAQVRRDLEALRIARRGVLPEDTSFDNLAPEAQLLYEIGDYRAVVEWLAPAMERVTRSPSYRLADPIMAAALVRAMILRSSAAAQLGDLKAARLWAQAVEALRHGSGGDPLR